jgi:hypothetical protein
MYRPNRIIFAGGAMLALAVIATVASPKLSAAIKAAFVEVVIPSHPFAGSAVLSIASPFNGVAVGPGSGTLGVTSITITNLYSSAVLVDVISPVMDGSLPGCAGNVVGSTTPHTRAWVQGNSTLQLTYPTPLVFGSCVAAQVSSGFPNENRSLRFDFNGFVN